MVYRFGPLSPMARLRVIGVIGYCIDDLVLIHGGVTKVRAKILGFSTISTIKTPKNGKISFSELTELLRHSQKLWLGALES